MHPYLHIYAAMFHNGLNIILKKLFPVFYNRTNFRNLAIQPFSVKNLEWVLLSLESSFLSVEGITAAIEQMVIGSNVVV